MSLKSNGALRVRVVMSHGVLRCLCPDVLEVQWRPSFPSPAVSWCPSLFFVLMALRSNGVLRLCVMTSPGVLVVCVLMSLKSNGVLRFRGLTSHGVLRCLCPDVPEIKWCPSSSCLDVSWCPSLFVS